MFVLGGVSLGNCPHNSNQSCGNRCHVGKFGYFEGIGIIFVAGKGAFSTGVSDEGKKLHKV